MIDEPNPELAPPKPSELWIVTFDHAYYPEVSYFETEAEAIVYANREIRNSHMGGNGNPGAKDDGNVSVARVVSRANIKVHF